MAVTRRTRPVLDRLLPVVQSGVRAELLATMGGFGPAARILVRRGVALVRVNSDLTYESALADKIVDADALEPFADIARSIAADGYSTNHLRLGLNTSYNAGIRVALAEVAPSDRSALMPLIAWTAHLAEAVERTEMTAFLAWHRERMTTGRYRQEMVRALLTGAVTPTSPCYRTLLVSPANHPDRLSRIHRQLTETDTLHLTRRRFVIVLHPLTSLDDPGMPLLDLPNVHIATAVGQSDVLAATYREAATVWNLVRSRGYPAGQYDLLSVAGDRLVTGDPELARRLRSVLRTVADSPQLLDTLRHWLLGDADRRTVAARLHVHPNTLDRRLRQIEERTGLSVARHSGLYLLHLALAAESAL